MSHVPARGFILGCVLIATRGWAKGEFYAWKFYNRTRYYWPQAQSRKRAINALRIDAARYGLAYKPAKPWWLP